MGHRGIRKEILWLRVNYFTTVSVSFLFINLSLPLLVLPGLLQLKRHKLLILLALLVKVVQVKSIDNVFLL